MKKILAVFLAVLMSVSVLTACSKEEPKNEELIIGKWEAVIDMSEMMGEKLQIDETMAEYIKISDFDLVFLFDFKDNNTVALTVDEEKLEDSFNSLFETLKNGLIHYFEAMIAQNQLDMTVDEMLAMSNLTMDQLIDDMSEAIMAAIDADSISYEYKYEVKDEKLFTWEEDEEMEEDVYISISFEDEDTLNFEGFANVDKEEVMKMIQKLTRIK